MGMGIVLLPVTAAMDEVAAALDAPTARYEGIHDATAYLRGRDVVCVVVDAAADSVTTDGAIRRFRRESNTAVVLAVASGNATAAIGADVTVVVDRTAPATATRRIAEVRADALVDRAGRRSEGAETLLGEATETVRTGEREGIEPLAAEVVASVGATEPYPIAWVGRHDTERRVVRPVAAAGVPMAHLQAVPVGSEAAGAATDGDATTAVTRRAVTADGGAAVFTEPLEADREGPVTDAGGAHLVALRIPTDPVTVLHLVTERPGGIPPAERQALTGLGSALTATAEGDTPTDSSEDRLRLLADVLAHELSNQLGAASLQLDLAREHGDDEHFDHVARALDRLEGLTEETRALARADPETEWTDLKTVVDSAWTVASAPNTTLQVENATLQVDPALVRLAVINLLRNAVEHGQADRESDEDGENDATPSLTVEVGPVGDDEGFYVADDGPGIPEAERDRVLEWGYSGGDGTGVGLGLVRVVAARHGWEVAIEQSEAGGARVALGPESSL